MLIIGRFHRAVRDGSVDFHLDFGRSRHFGGESLPAVRRRYRRRRHRPAAAAGTALTSRTLQ